MQAGFGIEALVEYCFFYPSATASIFAKIGFCGRDVDAIIRFVKTLSIEEIMREGTGH